MCPGQAKKHRTPLPCIQETKLAPYSFKLNIIQFSDAGPARRLCYRKAHKKIATPIATMKSAPIPPNTSSAPLA
jgi:hypothetical protein